MILIDFKEGSGLEVLAGLPHVSAVVTNAERGQLPRILTALTAERELRQQRLKTAGYDSFDDYQRSAPGSPLMPRLLVVVDEFAALRDEVPDAMARLVGIVRRGRSAGMHLVLSTQSVSSAVGQDIADNTTLHVCLRVENELESRTLLGVTDAARLPTSARGRGLVSDGQSLRLFQSGWLGHRTPDAADEQAVVVIDRSGRTAGTASSAESPAGDVPTDLQRVVRALAEAARAGGRPLPAPPWEPPLPEIVTLDEAQHMPAAAPLRGLCVVLGLLDAPARRARLPWTVDLAAVGHLAVVGGSRTGRTTFLRTLACAVTLGAAPGDVQVLAVEGGGRMLTGLAGLPAVRAVVSADDPERLSRLLRVATGEVDARQQLMARLGVGDLSELTGADARPRLVMLVDGFDALHDEGSSGDGEAVLEQLTVLLRQGAAVGLHVVLTTDATKAHTRIVGSIPAKLLLGLPDPALYPSLGVPKESVPVGALPPGRGIWTPSGDEVQVAVLDADASAGAQNEALARIGALDDAAAWRAVAGVDAPRGNRGTPWRRSPAPAAMPSSSGWAATGWSRCISRSLGCHRGCSSSGRAGPAARRCSTPWPRK